MSTFWLKDKFDFDSMGPEDMILSRFVEVLREYEPDEGPTIPEVLAGANSDNYKRILYCPLGTRLETPKLPAIFCSSGVCEYNPVPTVKAHVLTVRAVIRFEEWKPTDIAATWTAGLPSLVHLIRRAADSNPHLNFTPSGWMGEPLPLARHLETKPVDFQNVVDADGNLSTIWDCIVEFEYRTEVSKSTGRVWSLSVNSL